jgi:hypothetical protein
MSVAGYRRVVVRMKTAHSIPRTGLARAKGEHLQASNEPMPPSEMKRWEDRSWRYVPADATDIRATFKRHGWVPGVRGAR